MKSVLKDAAVTITFTGFLIVFMVMGIIIPDEGVSVSERRKLAAFPELSVSNLLKGSFTTQLDKYLTDNFPWRDSFRTIKAKTQYSVFGKLDNNNIYIAEGYAAAIEYPLKEGEIVQAAEKFNSIYNRYLKQTDCKTFYSIIPDKGFFLAEKYGYPSLDYDRLTAIMDEITQNMSYINIFDCLIISDYYYTDAHWRQEKLSSVATRLINEMKRGSKSQSEDGIYHASAVNDLLPGENDYRFDISKYTEYELSPFYGVYYGQSALPMEPDSIKYLNNSMLEQCRVFDYEADKEIGIYETDRFSGMDSYDIFLSGARALLKIYNANAESDREIIVFRDSFGSSIIPLMVSEYSTITLVDIRYIMSDYLESYIEFTNQDVLFLYCTSVLNNSTMLR